MATILLCIPTYREQIHAAAAFSIMQASEKHKVIRMKSDSSAQMYSMNQAWVKALELYDERKVDAFAMAHTDIAAEPNWLDKLVCIANEKDADIVCAVAPIKNGTGLTSIAYDEPVEGRPQKWSPRRLTMREIMAGPATFTAPNILLNTGLMLVDLSKPWCEKAYFSFHDEIVIENGKRVARFEPEDWRFSRMARELGAKSLWATRDVKIDHYGEAAYPNSVAYGTMESDTGKA